MLKERIAELVSQASGGELDAAEVLAADGPLPALGVTSLVYIRLLDAIELEYGVDLEAEAGWLETLDGLAASIETARAGAGR